MQRSLRELLENEESHDEMDLESKSLHLKSSSSGVCGIEKTGMTLKGG